MDVVLKYNTGFKWFKNERVYFKGYFYLNNTFFEKKEAVDKIAKFNSKNDILKFLKNVNGVFTFILKSNDFILIASDTTRAFPVFYAYSNDNWYISDDIIYLKTELEVVTFDDLATVELKASNHVHGFKTLLENVYQVQSSEYLIFHEDKIIERNFFYSYATNKTINTSYVNLKNKGKLAFEKAFNRQLNPIKNKTLVLPLSGGYDSRLIAVYLKKLKVKNVLCYTYGSKKSKEIEHSKKVAHALGYQWYFIEYSNNLIKDYLNSREFKDYFHYAGKLSSMPNLQEYFAVKKLRDDKLIPKDAIFLPGYAGDILGGSEYINSISDNLSVESISNIIFKTKMINFPLNTYWKNQLKTEIKKNLSLFNKEQSNIIETVFDDYNLKERITKFIFNSASFYTYFGYEFRFPFWDRELLDFFKEVPLEFKKDKSLYNSILRENYFISFNVDFDDKYQPKRESKIVKKIKKKLKPILPNFIKKNKLAANDWNNYLLITNKMLSYLRLEKVKIKRKYNEFNEIINQWYIYISKQKKI